MKTVSNQNPPPLEQRRTNPPPTDRPIWLVANIIEVDGAFRSARTFEGWAQSREGFWIGSDNLYLGTGVDDEVHPLEWMELKERAALATPQELTVYAGVYYWDSEFRRENGRSGFFACCDVLHSPTHTNLSSRSEGPFATQAEALDRLIVLLAAARHLGVAAELEKEAA